MRCLLRVVALFVFTIPIVAQPLSHADLSLDVYGTGSVPVAFPLVIGGYLRNYGPDPALNVVLTTNAGRFYEGLPCSYDERGRCVIDRVPVGAQIPVYVTIDRAPEPGTLAWTMEATSETHDPNPRNNRTAGTLTFTLAPRLRFSIYGGTADPGGTVEYQVTIVNDSPFPAIDAAFTLPLPEGWTFEGTLNEELRCEPQGRDVRCTVARIEPRRTHESRFVLRAPDIEEGTLSTYSPIRITTAHGVTGDDTNLAAYLGTGIHRLLRVTHSGDDGDGSLRAAMSKANEVCGTNLPQCRIVFDLPGATPHATIRPLTPLPVITKPVTIDGRGATRIEINGSLLTAGNGLEFHGFAVVRELVVNGFPGNGIVAANILSLNRCYIGTDITGTIAVPNGGRGVVIDSPIAYPSAYITDSVISGNGRSGVFAASGFGITLSGNRIGASAAEPPAPLGNGASGVYFGGASDVVVQKNLIAYNREAGIAIGGTGNFISIRANSIHSNGTTGIDYGLDLFTPGGGQTGVPPIPVITAVRYDASANITRIEGHAPRNPAVADVELFASTSPNANGYVEGELYLGRVSLKSNDFVFEHPGDLRGRFISATYTIPNSYYPEALSLRTSEFSAALRVEGDAAAPIDPAASVPRGADLWLRLNYPYTLLAAVPSFAWVNLESLGPAPPADVVIEIWSDDTAIEPPPYETRCVQAGPRLRCEMGSSRSAMFLIRAPESASTATLHARVTASSFDPDLTNNQTSLTINVDSRPYLELKVDRPGPADPGGTATFNVEVFSRSGVASSDVEVRIPLARDWSFVSSTSSHWSCAMQGQDVVCRTPRLEGGARDTFSVTVRAPAEYRHLTGTTARVTSAGGNQSFAHSAPVTFEIFRVFQITSTADAGSGSLRAAIEEANRLCLPAGPHCKIAFAIDASQAEDGVFSIKPAQPLPAVTANDITIDARTQGAPVELNGSLTATGSGLEIRSPETAIVRGLTIRSFPEHGIRMLFSEDPYPDHRIIADNVITMNGGRGIVVDTGETMRTNVDIVANTIAGNARAGIFIAAGNTYRIAANRIEGNGASGIFIGRAINTTVEGNEIARNAHAGIATDRNASWNGFRGNATYDNGGLGVDHAIDMVTFNDDPGRREDLPRYPVILSAVWDESAKVTRVEGRIEGKVTRGATVEIFANAAPDQTGYGETQRSVGEVMFGAAQEEQSFVFETAEDLRGSFITAVLSRHGIDSVRTRWTSEISQAIQVQ